MARLRILVASGDDRTREVLTGLLRGDPAEYEVLARGAAPGSLAELATYKPHVLLIDTGEDGADYGAVIRDLRKSAVAHDAGILALVAGRQPKEIEQLAQAGADGILQREEMSTELLRERVRMVAERVMGRWDTHLVSGDIVLSTVERCVELDGRRLPLSAALYDSLVRLLEKPGAVVSYHDLAGAEAGAPLRRVRNTAKSRIVRLRKTLGPAGRRIGSVPGFGYRLRIPAERA